MIVINSTSKELLRAKDALNELKEAQALGVEITTDIYKSAVEAMAAIIERGVLEENQKVVSPLGYDLTDFCNAIETQCTPALMSAFCTQSKSELADIISNVASGLLKEDTTIFEKFTSVNQTLNLCSRFFCLIHDTVAGDCLPIMEGEEAEKLKKAFVFANSPAMTTLLDTLMKKYGCDSYEKLAAILKENNDFIKSQKTY